MGPTGGGPPRPGQGLASALTRAGARPRHARGGGGGTRRGGEAGPEGAGESAHGAEGMEASLTGDSVDGERR